MTKNIKVDTVIYPQSDGQNIFIDIARFDLLHPVVSGNKFFKLKYNIQYALDNGYKGVLTMGGAYSNHLAATAFACRETGLQAKAIIRGETIQPLNHTLNYCTETGMEFIPVPRNLFDEHSVEVQRILANHPDCFFVPYGGSNEKGIKGASEMMEMVDEFQYYDVIICSIGSGTMLKGIQQSLQTHQILIGIPSMKIKKEDESLFIKEHSIPTCITKFYFEYAGKGFAKPDAQTLSFMNDFYEKNKVPTDFVYTGKLCYAVADLIERKEIHSSQKILIIHSGGLQGNLSLKKGTLIF